MYFKKAVVARLGYLAAFYRFENGASLFLGVRAFCVSAISYMGNELSERAGKIVLVKEIETLKTNMNAIASIFGEDLSDKFAEWDLALQG